MFIGLCARIYVSMSLVSTPHRISVPPPLCVVCHCGDERWLQIVMVFAPLMYLAHAGYLARPDCVDGDTSIMSSGGGAL